MKFTLKPYQYEPNENSQLTYSKYKTITKDDLIKGDLWFRKHSPNRDLFQSKGINLDLLDKDILSISDVNVAVDIGCRFGEWSRPMSSRFNKVIAFEAKELFCRSFVRNVKMDNVTLYNYALGNEEAYAGMAGSSLRLLRTKEGKANDYYTKQEFYNLPHGHKHHSKKAIITKLDYFNIDKIDFMKIDVDGFELMVLQGGESTILKNKPVIMIECLEHLYGKESCAWLEERGAKVVKEYYDGKNRLHDRLYSWN